MHLTPESIKLVRNVEDLSRRKFQYFNQICRLVDYANQKDNRSKFDELIFLAKFITNSWNILDRAGVESQETEKIKLEFTKSIETTQAIIGNLTEGEDSFSRLCEITTSEDFQEFRIFIHELSWLQNYYIERKAKR
ncbi:MAG: hypothetical protein HZB59_01525 [Ignavibacteriales bacterium]|nr:hypothetical protein [Ignavibacteriales bacterium]